MFPYPVILALDNIRSVHNVASLFRTADCVGVSKIILGGVTPSPYDRFGKPRSDFAKVALGAEKSVSWEPADRLQNILKKYTHDGFEIVALEQTKKSIPYTKCTITKPTVLVLGAEVEGISKSVLKYAHTCIEIPMSGEKESLNVSIAGAVALFCLRDQS